MKKSSCAGCYCDVYNHGCGGATECFRFKTAKIIWRKKVHIDQAPPYKNKFERYPDCYHVQRYVFFNKEQG
jgi:hypothetical protein